METAKLPDLGQLVLGNAKDRDLLKPVRGDQVQPRAEDGFYCLDKETGTDPCASHLVLKRGALSATDEEFDEAESFFKTDVRATPSFRGNPVTRKQATFGSTKYKTYQLFEDATKWPRLVQKVIDATQVFAEALQVAHPEEYVAVHANYYEDGDAGVSAHADDESQLVSDAAIFSYTFLKDKQNERARKFVIAVKPAKAGAADEAGAAGGGGVQGRGKVATVTLESGDLLVMGGQMQRWFTHELPKTQKGSDPSAVAPRLNFTVRRFNPAKPAHLAHPAMAGSKRSLSEVDGLFPAPTAAKSGDKNLADKAAIAQEKKRIGKANKSAIALARKQRTSRDKAVASFATHPIRTLWTTDKWKLVGEGVSGVEVHTVFSPETMRRVHEELRQAANAFPEFEHPEGGSFDNNDFLYVLGGLGTLGTPSSFHNMFVRKVRKAVHAYAIEHDIFGVKPGGVNAGKMLEQVVDRLMIRRPSQSPMADAWHRDVAAHAKEGDQVFGGWINLDFPKASGGQAPQSLTCIPGSGNEVGAVTDVGFSKFPEAQHAALVPRSVSVPTLPGQMILFNERTIHEVNASTSSDTRSRLFIGFRVSASGTTEPLTSHLSLRLDAQDGMPLKSGQLDHLQKERARELAFMKTADGAPSPVYTDPNIDSYLGPGDTGPPPVYSAMHWVNHPDKIAALAANFKPELRAHRFYPPKTPSGAKYPEGIPAVPKFLPSLEMLGKAGLDGALYPEYTLNEQSILMPLSWANLAQLAAGLHVHWGV